MAKRRVRLTETQYGELVESRDWCARNDMSGLRDFYDDELAFLAGRYALPAGAIEYSRDRDEERPRRVQR